MASKANESINKSKLRAQMIAAKEIAWARKIKNEKLLKGLTVTNIVAGLLTAGSSGAVIIYSLGKEFLPILTGVAGMVSFFLPEYCHESALRSPP